jgi:hypothetical protein
MEAWERRARKLEAKRSRIKKHGRSLLTAVRQAEERRARLAKKRAARQDGPGEGAPQP